MPINDPRKLFTHKLGNALSAEKKILTMLRKQEREAMRDELRESFRQHREETEQQIRNIEQAFQALGEKPTGRRSATAEGLAEEADTMLDKVDDELVDAVLLGGAAQTEHFEIGLYEALITQAKKMGEEQVASLLEQNLEQEKKTLERVEQAAEQVAEESAQLIQQQR